MPISTRRYSAARLVLELDGEVVGFLSAIEGGSPFAFVVEEPPDAAQIVRKHLGGVSYDPIAMSFGAGMGEPLYRWMGDWLDRKASARNGAVVFLDQQLAEQSRLEFDNALIAELTFPALDAASRDAASFRLTLQPELTRTSRASAGARHAGFGNKQKAWTSSNFRLRLDDLPTERVAKIDAMTVKQAYELYEGARHLRVGRPMQVPDLGLTLPESDAKDFVEWFEEFAIRGSNSEADERHATLEYLAANARDALFALTLSNLGIYRIEPERVEAGAEVVASVRVRMYCEQIALAAG